MTKERIMARLRAASTVALGVTVALLLAACGGSDKKDEGNGGATEGTGSQNVTLTWWHNSNNDPGKSYYEKVAADFEAANPGVKIEISARRTVSPV